MCWLLFRVRFPALPSGPRADWATLAHWSWVTLAGNVGEAACQLSAYLPASVRASQDLAACWGALTGAA